MLTTKIYSNTDIKKEWLDELQELFPELDITVVYTTSLLPAKYNPYFKKYWGDFNWIRSHIGDADVRCFLTTYKDLVSEGITGHYGMYDLTDRDMNHDFYIGLPVRLDKRAKANGFKSNFAWIFIHEYLHGEYRKIADLDTVHNAEEEGALLDLLANKRVGYTLLAQKISLLERIIELYAKIKSLQTNKK